MGFYVARSWIELHGAMVGSTRKTVLIAVLIQVGVSYNEIISSSVLTHTTPGLGSREPRILDASGPTRRQR